MAAIKLKSPAFDPMEPNRTPGPFCSTEQLTVRQQRVKVLDVTESPNQFLKDLDCSPQRSKINP